MLLPWKPCAGCKRQGTGYKGLSGRSREKIRRTDIRPCGGSLKDTDSVSGYKEVEPGSLFRMERQECYICDQRDCNYRDYNHRDCNHIDYNHIDCNQGKCSCGEEVWAKV